MDVYLYKPAGTLIHRLDARVKLLITFGGFVVFLTENSLSGILIFFLLALLYAFYGKAIRNILKVRTILISIAIFTFIIWSITENPSGRELFWGITLGSVKLGAIIAIKITGMLILGIVFLTTTKNEEIVLALVKMKIPYRFAFAFSTALRLLPTFLGTGATVVQAQKSRGLELEKGNFIQRFKRYAPLIGPIILIALRNTDNLAIALETKGFGRKGNRTFYFVSRIKPIDILLVLILSLIVVCVKLVN